MSARVLVGDTPAASVESLRTAEARVTTPAHAAGPVAVSVTANGETVTQNNAFTFVAPPPTIAGVRPTSGPSVGGNQITFTLGLGSLPPTRRSSQRGFTSVGIR